jgi:hypothetical protein
MGGLFKLQGKSQVLSELEIFDRLYIYMKRTHLIVVRVFCFVRKLIPLGQEIRVLCSVVAIARILANFFDKFAKPQVQPLVPLS